MTPVIVSGTQMNSRQTLDGATWLFAALAVMGFWQGVALALTIISTLIAITLGGFRLHDRIKYGPVRRG